MKQLTFTYAMELSTSRRVAGHRFTLKCLPRSNARQEVLSLDYSVSPNDFLCPGTDGFGNRYIYGAALAPHDHLRVYAQGVVRTGLADGVPVEDAWKLGMYRVPTPLTAPGARLYALCARMADNAGATGLARALELVRLLRANFAYAQGVTGTATDAETALSLGRGVCQDYAHILIALCRLKGIPARYVAGLLIGEGVSHAWVEVWDAGRWYALDPTNDLLVSDAHICFSVGRDARDCAIDRGLFSGAAEQRQTVCATVEAAQN